MIVNDGPGHKAEIGLRVTLDDVMLPNTRFKYVYTPVCDELNVQFSNSNVDPTVRQINPAIYTDAPDSETLIEKLCTIMFVDKIQYPNPVHTNDGPNKLTL